MINIKHFLDPVEPDDGLRLWVEPIGLTRDLRSWCSVHCVLTQLAPPREVCNWFERHGGADAYEYFRALYHEHLSAEPCAEPARELAGHAACHDVTLLHQGDDPAHNTATALYEYLSELSQYNQADA